MQLKTFMSIIWVLDRARLLLKNKKDLSGISVNFHFTQFREYTRRKILVNNRNTRILLFEQRLDSQKSLWFCWYWRMVRATSYDCLLQHAEWEQCCSEVFDYFDSYQTSFRNAFKSSENIFRVMVWKLEKAWPIWLLKTKSTIFKMSTTMLLLVNLSIQEGTLTLLIFCTWIFEYQYKRCYHCRWLQRRLYLCCESDCRFDSLYWPKERFFTFHTREKIWNFNTLNG